jgi:hypothetical protein
VVDALCLYVNPCAVGPQLHPPAAAWSRVPALPQGLPQVRPSQVPLINSLQTALQGGVDHMCIVQLASSGTPELDSVDHAHAVLTLVGLTLLTPVTVLLVCSTAKAHTYPEQLESHALSGNHTWRAGT